jgi:soluble lytic murein transglycosylase-like protein
MPRARANPIARRFVRRLGQAAGASVQQLLVQAAARYGIDPSLVMAIAQRESGFRNIVNPRTGACGVMQLLPATAAAYGVTNCLDPASNIDAGVHVLADYIRQFGDVVKAVAAYDWGSGHLSSAIAQWGEDWFSHAPAETQAYVTAITGPPATSPAPGPPLTIDASTGLPIEDSTPTPTAQAAGFKIPTTGNPLLDLAIAGAGALLLSEFLD